MSIAVVDFNDLKALAVAKGFPLHTKVSLETNGVGYELFNPWIRANVKWVSELGFDPINHVKITETAQLTGDLPNPWELRTQKFIEGTDEFNSFKPLIVDGKEFYVVVNGDAIKKTIQEAELRYVLEFEGQVIKNIDLLKVAVFDKAEDSSITYHSDVPVEYIYCTEIKDVDGEKHLYKYPYTSNPTSNSDEAPRHFVGVLSKEEYDIWVANNIKEASTVGEVPVLDPNLLRAFG